MNFKLRDYKSQAIDDLLKLHGEGVSPNFDKRYYISLVIDKLVHYVKNDIQFKVNDLFNNYEEV